MSETAINEHISRLASKVETAGLRCEDLDELVHEVAASVAADVNDAGLEAQIEYLIGVMGVAQTERDLDAMVTRAKQRKARNHGR